MVSCISLMLCMLVGSFASSVQDGLPFGDRISFKDVLVGDSHFNVVVNNKFCTSMADTLYINGAKAPSQSFQYDLCIDTNTSSWKHVAVDKKTNHTITTMVDGKNLYTYDHQLKTCETAPAPPNPLSNMPFTMILIDADSQKNGTATVDGIPGLTVFHHHRSQATHGHFFQPAEDMFWYVNSKNELVQGKCVIKKQPGYPMDTVATHDYFGRGKYTEEVPSDTFQPEKSWKCPPSTDILV